MYRNLIQQNHQLVSDPIRVLPRRARNRQEAQVVEVKWMDTHHKLATTQIWHRTDMVITYECSTLRRCHRFRLDPMYLTSSTTPWQGYTHLLICMPIKCHRLLSFWRPIRHMLGSHFHQLAETIRPIRHMLGSHIHQHAETIRCKWWIPALEVVFRQLLLQCNTSHKTWTVVITMPATEATWEVPTGDRARTMEQPPVLSMVPWMPPRRNHSFRTREAVRHHCHDDAIRKPERRGPEVESAPTVQIFLRFPRFASWPGVAATACVNLSLQIPSSRVLIIVPRARIGKEGSPPRFSRLR